MITSGEETADFGENDGEESTELAVLPRNYYDDDFVQAYIENPELGKLGVLKAIGHHNPTKQCAYRMHKRLAHIIDEELTHRMKEGTVFGYSILLKLARESESDTVKLGAARDLLNYGGRKPADVLEIKEHKDEDALDKEIAELQREIDKFGETYEGEFEELEEGDV